jgi:hypothetical protein
MEAGEGGIVKTGLPLFAAAKPLHLEVRPSGIFNSSQCKPAARACAGIRIRRFAVARR